MLMSEMMHDPVFYVLLMTALIVGAVLPLVVIRVMASKQRSEVGSAHDPHLG